MPKSTNPIEQAIDIEFALGGIKVLRAEYPTTGMHGTYLTYAGNEEPRELSINNRQRAALHSPFDHHYTSYTDKLSRWKPVCKVVPTWYEDGTNPVQVKVSI